MFWNSINREIYIILSVLKNGNFDIIIITFTLSEHLAILARLASKLEQIQTGSILSEIVLRRDVMKIPRSHITSLLLIIL